MDRRAHVRAVAATLNVPRVKGGARPSPAMLSMVSPLLAVAITAVVGAALFVLAGHEPWQALRLFFVEPIGSAAGWSEVALKATPLVLIALGLAACFRAEVWNIGAEGQFIMGAICAGGVAILVGGVADGAWVIVAVLAAGVIGGTAWAAIVALLRERFGASEILTSLMLVYVAELLLAWLVYGPWKDPQGFNFPQTIAFGDAARVPRLGASRLDAGLLLALIAVPAMWLLLERSRAGFRWKVGGLAPAAALYAGYSQRATLWSVLLLSGALAGLAGALHAAGPLGQLTPYVPAGYGFAAIVVAFVGRLHPVGIVFAGVLMSVVMIGGELAQSRFAMPKSLSSMFQGLLLFALLACDALMLRRLARWKR